MQTLRGLGLLGLCAIGAMLAPSADAVAKEAGHRGPRVPAALLLLKASDGYTAQVLTNGRQVVLQIAKGNVEAAYLARGKVAADGLDVRFGKLGRIAVKFHSGVSRQRGAPQRDCGLPFEFGIFRGTIRFRGEQDYVTIDTKRAFGILLDFDKKPCSDGARSSALLRQTPLNTHFTAVAREKGAVTSLELLRRQGQETVLLKALRTEQRGRMRILRRATTAVGGENAFIASGPGIHPAFAYLAAPKPFNGSAVYEEVPGGGTSWTGSLTAWLPGAGKVPLSGPGFATSFCRTASDEPGCNPEPPVKKPFWLAQGSGSQSQAFGDARLSWSR